ncbi:MAG: DUF6879 family protein [Candidatus Dormibacteria bacterium]
MNDDEVLRQLLGAFRVSAWRLEALAEYAVPQEEATLAAFLRGAPERPSTASFSGFLDFVRSLPATGRTLGRVHAIAGPLTPYLRYEIEWGYVSAAGAGEDIRIVHRPSWQDTPFGEQPPDFWLVDDESVALMHYDDRGRWLGMDLLTAPAAVAPYRQLRDLALASAVPLTDYLAALRIAQVDPSPLLQPSPQRIAS